MDENKMQSIKYQYLMNFEKNMQVKQINSNDEEICNSKQELDDKKTIGYYVSKNNSIYGVFRYHKTLYLMIDQNIYDIKQMNLIFECKNVDDQRRSFMVKYNEKTLGELIYERKTDFVDNWSREDDLDMFAWISNIYTRGRLDNILQ